jgi:hypothetical protein
MTYHSVRSSVTSLCCASFILPGVYLLSPIQEVRRQPHFKGKSRTSLLPLPEQLIHLLCGITSYPFHHGFPANQGQTRIRTSYFNNFPEPYGF